VLALAALLPAGCGSDDAGSGGGAGIGGPNVLAAPPRPDLEAYRRRCERIARRGAPARVLYESRRHMRQGDTETVGAAVTLNRTAPRERLLPGADGEDAGVVVTCRLQARLDAAQDDFDVSDEGWVERSLLGGDTATWRWFVTPKLGGTHSLTLRVRPIVRQRPTGRPSEADVAAASAIREYEARVDVDVPWNKRPEELMTRMASVLGVAEGLIKALTALLVAALALVVGWKKLRRGVRS
jgi:hypothetical protein